MPITAKVDVSKAVQGLRDFEKTQLPFVLAKTLTGVAQDAQVAVKENVRKAFKLRNSWTEQGIRIVAADKRGDDGRITATVYTDTANRATGAPDYLGRQEDGGEKVPFGGHQYLAVPTKYLREMAPGVIPEELRPKNLLGALGGRYQSFGRKTGGIALRNQRRVKGFVFFIQEMKDNDKAIMGRYFTDRDAYPFYLLITEANIKKSALTMVETVQRVAQANFDQRWADNFRQIRLRGIRL